MKKQMIRRIVDLCMTVLMILLMSFQVTGDVLHEWLGMGMVAVAILHNVLNRRWYGSMFRGQYTALRVGLIMTNIGVIVTFILTGISGMAISGYAVPFMYGIIPNMTARVLHLSMSYWSMIFLGLHLGFHWGMILKAIRKNKKEKKISFLSICGYAFAAYGFFVLVRDGIPSYLLARTHFAFYNYEKNFLFVLFDTIAMMSSFVFLGYEISKFLKRGKNYVQ